MTVVTRLFRKIIKKNVIFLFVWVCFLSVSLSVFILVLYSYVIVVVVVDWLSVLHSCRKTRIKPLMVLPNQLKLPAKTP